MKKINVFIITLISIMMLLSLLTAKYINDKNIGYSEELVTTNNVVGEIFKGEEKKQEIYSDRKNLSGIKIIFGTYKRINDDEIKFELYEKNTNKKIREEKIQTKKLLDNTPYNITFKKIKDSENKAYYFKLNSMRGSENNAVTVYSTESGEVVYDLGYLNLEKNINFYIYVMPSILLLGMLLFNYFNYKKKIPLLTVFFLAILIVETAFLINKSQKNVEYYSKFTDKETKFTVGGLHESDQKRRKNFIFSNENNLSGIKLKFGTYNRKNTNRLIFKLYDANSNKEIRRVRLNAENFDNNHPYNIEFSSIKNSKSRYYYFKIFALGGKDKNTVTLYTDSYENVMYDLGYLNVKESRILYFLSIFILVMGISTILYLYKIKNIEKEKVFLMLSLIYGTIILFLFPPLQTPDETSHFMRSYAISKGEITTKKVNENRNINNMPDSILKFIETMQVENIKFKSWGKLDLVDIEKASQLYLNEQKTKQVDMGGTAVINPISYFPQALGIGIARIMHLPILFIFYFGRIINFAVWISVIYYAIKNAPEKIKNILLIVSLLPIGVQQGLSYSTDGSINAFSMLLISFLFKLYLTEEEKFNWRYFIILFLGVFIPTTAKVVYIFSIILLFGIPLKKFRNKKAYIGTIFMITFVTLFVNVSWSFISPENPVSPVGQMEYLKNNLFDHIGTIYLTTREMFQFYVESSVGVLGYLDTRLPYMVIYGYWILILIQTLSNKIFDKRNYKMKNLIIFYLLISYTGILTALYIAWTRPGHTYIDGVQGRYFLPMIPLLLIIFSTKKIEINRDILQKNTNIFLNFGLIYTIIILISRYYLQ